MLHDGIMSRLTRRGKLREDRSGHVERRDSDRLPFPAEMVLVWNHDVETAMRYRVVDAGDGGYRIRTSAPLLEGMTGMVIRMLPSHGERLDQPVVVAWTHPVEDTDGEYEAGLRCF